MKTSKAIILSSMLIPLVLTKHNLSSDFRPASWVEDKTDELLYEMTMEEFQAERTSPDHLPFLDWRNNGCTSAPDKPFGYNFLPSCQRHDFCYLNYRQQGRYKELKSSCDDNFQEDMYKECAKLKGRKGGHCRSVARVYHWAVKTFGNNYKMYQLPTNMLEILQDAEAPGQEPDEVDPTSDSQRADIDKEHSDKDEDASSTAM